MNNHLVYAFCHRMPEQIELFPYNVCYVSTAPLYHGFGLLAPFLVLSIGMPCVLPPASVIPTARSTLSMLTSTKESLTPPDLDTVNNRDSWLPIVEFIDDQHEAYVPE